MIECTHLTKAFGRDRPAVEDVSLRVARGESYCLLGAPASGKTTIVEMFRAVVAPTSGRALINDIDCWTQSIEIRRQTLFVTPGSSLVESLSLRDNVRFFARVAGHATSRLAVDNALRRVGLPEASFGLRVDEIDRKETTLLAWLAVGLIRQVTAAVLDEPTRELGARSTEWAVEGVREIQKTGATLLIATSDAPFATAVGARIGLLRAGRKDAEYRPDEVSDEHLASFYVQYLGRPSSAAAPARPA